MNKNDALAKTDWDSYYNRPYISASITRKITTSVLSSRISDFVNENSLAGKFSITELGGANSCFFESLDSKFKPSSYTIVDNNKIGLEKFKERFPSSQNVRLQEFDILKSSSNVPFAIEQSDCVFSIGLIEHFTGEELIKSIEAHYHFVRPGGLIIISFPTPTFLYRITRSIAETLGMWIFHDETPLYFKEVEPFLSKQAEILRHDIIWPIVLTQTMVVAKKI